MVTFHCKIVLTFLYDIFNNKMLGGGDLNSNHYNYLEPRSTKDYFKEELFYHWHNLELPAYGVNKKQADFQLGLLLFLNSKQQCTAFLPASIGSMRARGGERGADGGKPPTAMPGVHG